MKYFVYIVIGAVAAVIIAGFFVVGSPREERMRRFDEQRIQHLQQLQWNIIDYWQNKGKLPAQLADLNDPTRGVIVPMDPAGIGEGYGYEITGPEKFRLCATFSLSNYPGGAQLKVSGPAPVGGPGGDVWTHGSGRVCFDRVIDKDFFAPKKPAQE